MQYLIDVSFFIKHLSVHKIDYALCLKRFRLTPRISRRPIYKFLNTAGIRLHMPAEVLQIFYKRFSSDLEPRKLVFPISRLS